MTAATRKTKVGDLRPSQLLHSFGVGALLDLPNLSALVMGLDDWETAYATEIGEDRLLAAVRGQLGPSVKRLLAPPVPVETEGAPPQPFDPAALVGVPVAPFPQWMYCPYCKLLAPLGSGRSELRPHRYHADRTRYVHLNCTKPGNPTPVLRSRFLVACAQGHLDDFPWIFFVHEGPSECKSVLRLNEPPTPGEATNVFVQCDTCGKRRPIASAFGRDGRYRLPVCRGRRPHLRNVEPAGRPEPLRAILLGASNSWFPVTLSAFAIPTASGKLPQLVESAWTVLEKAISREVLRAFRQIGQLPALAAFSDEELWAAVETQRLGRGEVTPEIGSLRAPEWAVLSQPDPQRNGPDFRLAPVEPPMGFRALIDQVVLECGYTAASLSERIYARPIEAEDGPMAGVLIYTAAPDSEGTLGGLVGLGQPEGLGRHVRDALEGMRLCASDPLCAEHQPVHQGTTLHGAACHGCLFVPETSCERGNKYLDRLLLIDTLAASGRAFFPMEWGHGSRLVGVAGHGSLGPSLAPGTVPRDRRDATADRDLGLPTKV